MDFTKATANNLHYEFLDNPLEFFLTWCICKANDVGDT